MTTRLTKDGRKVSGVVLFAVVVALAAIGKGRLWCNWVCPAGAIEVIPRLERKNVHMGHAIWKKDRCIRISDGVSCTACARKCPVKAIHIVEGFPVVDKGACIGCGACATPQARPRCALLSRARGRRPVDNFSISATGCQPVGLFAARTTSHESRTTVFHLPVLRPRGQNGFGGERPPPRADGNSVSLVWLSNEIHTSDSPGQTKNPL